MSENKIKVTLKNSAIGRQEKQKRIIAALGLRKLHQTKVHKDTPIIRGMIKKVVHLVETETVEA
ncbi:50S ribosomal protein L30 [bacterium]|nr:50S ribosomal protein L30 [bacterium]